MGTVNLQQLRRGYLASRNLLWLSLLFLDVPMALHLTMLLPPQLWPQLLLLPQQPSQLMDLSTTPLVLLSPTPSTMLPQLPQLHTPQFPIAVPTVLKGTQTVNAPIVKTQTEIHNVQEPVLVNKPYDAPYDAPFYTEKIVEVPTPVHVDAPYNVHVPVPVQGEPIIKKTVAAPVVTHSHHVQAAPAVAAPAVAAAGYAVAAPAAVAHY